MALRRAPNPAVPLRRLALAVSLCFAAGPALALPTGGQVTHGSATFAQSGATLAITNSNGAIIQWPGFSIGSGELVRFNQPNAASSVLNRVVGSDPSVLLGQLQSNGRVFLINPAGILVGAGARIDVAGFVASTLQLSDLDFLAGRFNFQAVPNAAGIRNDGTITTPSGGSVYLVAPQVDNAGLIQTPGGEVILAAGQTVQIGDTATPGVRVEVSGSATTATNVGSVIAEAGRVGLVGALVKNSGTLSAASAVDEGGRVFLRAADKVEQTASGRIDASGTRGGSVTLAAGDTTLVAGSVTARGDADSGGNVQIVGARVGVLDDSRVDVSGVGGGSILLGGDYQGANVTVRNAWVTYLAPRAALAADAIGNGDGGKVIVWSDDTTRAYGSISARSAGPTGHGGLIETSGRRFLDVEGIRVDATAVAGGKSGFWLLDPNNVTIVHGTSASDDNIVGTQFLAPASSSANSTISDGTLNSALASFSLVRIQTTSDGSAGVGDILFDGTTNGAVLISKSAADAFSSTLEVQAHHDIRFRGTVGFETSSAAGSGALTLSLSPAFGRASIIEAGADLSLQGRSTPVTLITGIGFPQDINNFGTVRLIGKAVVDLDPLGYPSTFTNQVGGVVQVATDSSIGWPFLSNNVNQNGVVNNFGVWNADLSNGSQSYEVAFSNAAGATLNIANGGGSRYFSMQNGDQLNGNIHIGAGSTLWLSEYHGATSVGLASGLTVSGPGTLLAAAGVPLNFASGVTFDNLVFHSQDGDGFQVPAGLQIVGNVALIAEGPLVLVNGANFGITNAGTFMLVSTSNISASDGLFGNASGSAQLKLVAGWNGTVPADPFNLADYALGRGGDLLIQNAQVFSGGSIAVKTAGNVDIYGITTDANLNAQGGPLSVEAGGNITVTNLGAPHAGLLSSGDMTLSLTGNSSRLDVLADTSAGGPASIVSGGTQIIDFTAAGTHALTITGGSGAAAAGSWAEIWARAGDQYIRNSGGGTLDIALTGGNNGNSGQAYWQGTANASPLICASCATNNGAYLNAKGNQYIGSAANKVSSFVLTGGSQGNGNDAWVDSEGVEQKIYVANVLSLNSGTSGGLYVPGFGLDGTISNGAGITASGTQTISVTGDMNLHALGDTATVGGATLLAPVQRIAVGGNLTMTGGASNATSYVEPTSGVKIAGGVLLGNLSAADIQIDVGGTFTMTPGSGNGGSVLLGAVNGGAGNTISVQAANMVIGQTGMPSIAGIGSLDGALATITLHDTGSGGEMLLDNRTRIAAGGGSVTLRTSGGDAIHLAQNARVATKDLLVNSADAFWLQGQVAASGDVTVSTGSYVWVDADHAGSATFLRAGGNMNVTTGSVAANDGSIYVQNLGGTRAELSATGSMTLNLGGTASVLSVEATATAGGPALIKSGGTQTIDFTGASGAAGKILELLGGTGSAPAGASAMIETDGNQFILNSGGGTLDIRLTGGDTGATGRAEWTGPNGTGTQICATCSTQNNATLKAGGTQTFGTASRPVTSVALQGGSNGVGNEASIDAGGNQTLFVSGNVTLTGGASGGAFIPGFGLDGTLDNGAGLSTNGTQTLNIGGNLSLDGGATGAPASTVAGAFVVAPVQRISVGGDLTLTGGASTAIAFQAAPSNVSLASAAIIGYDQGADLQLDIGNRFIMTPGSGSAGGTFVGTIAAGASASTVRIRALDMHIGAPAAAAPAGIGALDASDASVTLQATGVAGIALSGGANIWTGNSLLRIASSGGINQTGGQIRSKDLVVTGSGSMLLDSAVFASTVDLQTTGGDLHLQSYLPTTRIKEALTDSGDIVIQHLTSGGILTLGPLSTSGQASVQAASTLVVDGVTNGSLVFSKNAADASSSTFTFGAGGDIHFQGNVGFATTGAGSSGLNLVLSPGGKAMVDAGSTLTLNGRSGAASLALGAGSPQILENSGTIDLQGNAFVDLDLAGYASTFDNKSSGIVNVATTSAAAWPFRSNASSQNGVVNNAGTWNADLGNASQSYEVQFNNLPGGTLNIVNGGGSRVFSMQNGNQLDGTVNIDASSRLWLSEYHGGSSVNFASGLRLNGPGMLEIAATVPVTVTPGARFTDALIYDRHTSGIILPSGVQIGGNFTFITDGALILASAGNYGATTSGTFLLVAGGNLSGSGGSLIQTGSGPVGLVAGWDGVMPTTPTSFAAFNVTPGTGHLALANEQIHVAGNLAVKTGADVRVVASSAGASASLAADGTLDIDAGRNVLVYNQGGAQAGIFSSGIMTVHLTGSSGDLEVRADALAGGPASIVGQGLQTIDFTGGGSHHLVIAGGSGSAAGAWAMVEAHGDQRIANSGGGVLNVSLTGGDTASTGRAEWTGPNGTGTQVCAACSTQNNATLKAGGNQSIGSAANPVTSITLSGGNNGVGNEASIDAHGSQALYVSGNVTLVGGASGGVFIPGFGTDGQIDNSASISADGNQLLRIGGSVSLDGGGRLAPTTSLAGAFIVAPTQDISVGGDLLLTGGGSSATALALTPLGTNLASAAVIGWDSDASIQLSVGNRFALTPGSGTGGGAYVGTINGSGATSIAVTAAQLQLGSATATTAAAGIGGLDGSNATITLRSSGGAGMQLGSGAAILAGSGGSITLSATGGGGITQTAGKVTTDQLQVNSTGSIDLGAQVFANSVDLVTTGGSINLATFSPTTHIVRASAAAGDVTLTHQGSALALGQVVASGTASITSFGSILDDNGSGVANVTAPIIRLASQGGSASTLAISADVVSPGGQVTAIVDSGTPPAFGGIHLESLGASGPASLTLRDFSSAGGDIFYRHQGNLNLAGYAIAASHGSAILGATGNLTLGNGTLSSSGGTAVSSGGTLAVGGTAAVGGDLTVTATGPMTLSGTVDCGSGSLALSAPTVLVPGGRVTAAQTVRVIAQNLGVGGGGLLESASGNLDLQLAGQLVVNGGGQLVAGSNLFLIAPSVQVDTGQVFAAQSMNIVANDMEILNGGGVRTGQGNLNAAIGDHLLLRNGAVLAAGDDVRLVLAGADAKLMLNDVGGLSPARIEADNFTRIAATVYVDFLGRSDGGVLIDGVESTTTVPGSSGFYNAGSPALDSSGLKIVYGLARPVGEFLNDLLNATGDKSSGARPLSLLANSRINEERLAKLEALVNDNEFGGGSATEGNDNDQNRNRRNRMCGR